MICPNCFFENKDETKSVCPFCGFAYPLRFAEWEMSENAFFKRPSRMDSQETPETIDAPAPTVDLDALITTYHGEKIPPIQSVPDQSDSAEASPENPAEQSTRAVSRSERKEADPAKEKKKRLPVWAQIAIWIAGLAAITVGSYYFSLYAAEHIKGWPQFWENIFANWR